MKPYNHHKFTLTPSPQWAESTNPGRRFVRDMPCVLVLDLERADEVEVASRAAAEAIADPASPMGRIFRRHCALWPLSYISKN